MKSMRFYLSLGIFWSLTSCKPLKMAQDKRDSSPAGAPVSSDRPKADIDPDASFMLIPKPDDSLSSKLDKLPDSQALTLSDGVLSKGSGSTQDFYLAINRRELSQKWFLTASTKQLYPSWYALPYANLGTRVVTFATQNAKLFVFDVDERRSGSSVSAPTVVMDAFPIVPVTPKLRALGINENFIVFDPAEGIAGYSPVRDLFARLSGGTVEMKTDLQYLRRYKKIQDGIYYEMVFSGMTQIDLTASDPIQNQDPNPTRVVGTLGITLRRYSESGRFSTRDASELKQAFYFTGSDGTFGTNATQAAAKGLGTNPVLKWGVIRPGMSPIVFRISPQIKSTQTEFPEYDVIGSVIRGVESWNDVFGFRVFKVIVGTESDSWAADDLNMIIWDDRADLGYAYADARINPVNGEIRGANIYIDASQVFYADEYFNFLDPVPLAKARTYPQRAKSVGRMSGFRWGDMDPVRLCDRPSYFTGSQAQMRLAQLKKSEWKSRMAPFTRKTAVENYLSHVMAHEVGHILGLRHNFKASTFAASETSSVMDYYDNVLSALKPFPSVYDKQAINFLYGKSQVQPNLPFCTDEDISSDPYCRQFDYGVDPLQAQLLPTYRYLLEAYLQRSDPEILSDLSLFLQEVLDFVQAGPSSQQKQAWEGLVERIRAKAPAPGSSPLSQSYAEVSKVLIQLFLITPDSNAAFASAFAKAPQFEPAAASVIAEDLAAMALNVDSIRDMELRRLAIDALKKMRADAALQSLTQLKADLISRKANLPAAQAILEGDLIARVESYLTPYY